MSSLWRALMAMANVDSHCEAAQQEGKSRFSRGNVSEEEQVICIDIMMEVPVNLLERSECFLSSGARDCVM